MIGMEIQFQANTSRSSPYLRHANRIVTCRSGSTLQRARSQSTLQTRQGSSTVERFRLLPPWSFIALEVRLECRL